MSSGNGSGWIGVDLDGTLARYDGWKGADHIGEPIPEMMDRVRMWLAEGIEVRIVTARVARTHLYPVGTEQYAEGAVAYNAIKEWLAEHLGRELEVTCMKDFGMVELWDDRCIQVVTNLGKPVVNQKELLDGFKALLQAASADPSPAE